MPHGRVILWYFRKKPAKKRPYNAGQEPNGTGLLPDVHESKEKGHHADQLEG